MPYILLTRPLEDSLHMEKGARVPIMKAPLLRVLPLDLPPEHDWQGYDHLIVTSPRSFSFFPFLNEFLKKPVWCVGKITESKARDLGFQEIYTANHSALHLCQKIEQSSFPHRHRFLHIGGETLHYNIAEHLQQKGYAAEYQAVYRTEALASLSPDIQRLFEKRDIRLLPLFSHKTAEVFEKIAHQYGLSRFLDSVTLVTSPHLQKDSLESLPWKAHIRVDPLSMETLEALFHQQDSSAFKEKKSFSPSSMMGLSALISLAISTGVVILKDTLNPPFVPSPEFPKGYPVFDEWMDKVEDRLSASPVSSSPLPSSTHSMPMDSGVSPFSLEQLAQELTALKKDVTTLHHQAQLSSQRPPAPSKYDSVLPLFFLTTKIRQDLLADRSVSAKLWSQLRLHTALFFKTQGLSFPLSLSQECPKRKTELLAHSVFTPLSSPQHSSLSHGFSADTLPLWGKPLSHWVGPLTLTCRENDSGSPPSKEKDILLALKKAIEGDAIPDLQALQEGAPSPEYALCITQALDRLRCIEDVTRLQSHLLSLPPFV